MEKLKDIPVIFAETVSSSKQTWMPFGPQRNVEEGRVARGGWRECYRKGYSNLLSDSDVTNIETNKCRGRNIMLSCRKKSSTLLKVYNLGLLLTSFLRLFALEGTGLGSQGKSVQTHYWTRNCE